LSILSVVGLSIYLSLRFCSPYGPWPPSYFLNLYTVGRTPWTGDQPVARPLPTRRTTQTQNKRTQTSMPWVGFEPTIPSVGAGEDGSCFRPPLWSAVVGLTLEIKSMVVQQTIVGRWIPNEIENHSNGKPSLTK
jgi:hypothetical protein